VTNDKRFREKALEALLNSTVAVLGGELRRLKAEAIENEKIMANQAELLDKLTDRKRKEKEAERKFMAPRARLLKNKSWLASVKLGLKQGLWSAPAEYLKLMRQPAVALMFSAGALVLGTITFAIGRPILVIAGLLGFVSERGERP
jgi:hypothetical protein